MLLTFKKTCSQKKNNQLAFASGHYCPCDKRHEAVLFLLFVVALLRLSESSLSKWRLSTIHAESKFKYITLIIAFMQCTYLKSAEYRLPS